MNVAYFIMLHKFEQQFEWLLHALWNPHDIFLIHINKTSPERFEDAIKELTAEHPNVLFLPRIPITWGGWSIVEASLEAIRFLCRRPEDWRYFVNLSGQDYPIRPLAELRAFLRQQARANYLDIRRIDAEPYHIRRRLHWYCLERTSGLARLHIPNVRAVCASVEWYGGLWGMFTRDFCEWLTRSELTEYYRRALRHTKIPDEFFFQTLLMRSPYATTHDPDPRRYIDFQQGSPGPRTLTMHDLEPLTRSTAFFARKFDQGVDAQVLRHLARRIDAAIPTRLN